jgi:hypothetical protein
MGSSVLRGFEGDQTVGVATANGALCLLHTTFNPQPPLLEVMEQVLPMACATDSIRD